MYRLLFGVSLYLYNCIFYFHFVSINRYKCSIYLIDILSPSHLLSISYVEDFSNLFAKYGQVSSGRPNKAC